MLEAQSCGQGDIVLKRIMQNCKEIKGRKAEVINSILHYLKEEKMNMVFAWCYAMDIRSFN